MGGVPEVAVVVESGQRPAGTEEAMAAVTAAAMAAAMVTASLTARATVMAGAATTSSAMVEGPRSLRLGAVIAPAPLPDASPPRRLETPNRPVA